MSTTVAFFDLDGSMTTAHVWRGLSRYAKLYHMNMGHYRRFMLTHLHMWFLSKVGLVNADTIAPRWGGDTAAMLTGYTWEQAQELFHWIMEQEIRPGLRPKALEALHFHQEQGHLVVLVSSTFQDLLKVIGQELGISHVVGTGLETHNGRYTGRTEGPVCVEQGKVKLLLAFLQREEKDVDMKTSWVYASHMSDVPMLEMVGHPVATFPKKSLRRYSQERNWFILDECLPQAVLR